MAINIEAPALGGLVPCSKTTSLISLATSAPSKCFGGLFQHTFGPDPLVFFDDSRRFFELWWWIFQSLFVEPLYAKRCDNENMQLSALSPYPSITASEWPVQAIFGLHPPELSGCWLCAWRATNFFSNLWCSTLPGAGSSDVCWKPHILARFAVNFETIP